LRDPGVRDRTRAELAGPPMPSFPLNFEIATVYAVGDPALSPWVGRSVGELVAERGGDPLGTFLDLCLEDNPKTTFFAAPPSQRGGRMVTEALVRNPLAMAGSSDGGAHLASFVGVDYTTRPHRMGAGSVLALRGRTADHVHPGCGPWLLRPWRGANRGVGRSGGGRSRAAQGGSHALGGGHARRVRTLCRRYAGISGGDRQRGRDSGRRQAHGRQARPLIRT
jgi:hypothetical protein